MRRLFTIAATVLAISGCSLVQMHDTKNNPYNRTQFYAKYLNPSVPLDQRIQRDLDLLRANPRDAVVHNDLGQLLQQKGFPKDAELEFKRAVDADSHFYPAWYNLGLMRASRGDGLGARYAFSRTVHYKPGHSAALFQMGLIEERAGNVDAAIDYYAKAFLINHELLYAQVNPMIVDSKLVDRALLKAYPRGHAREVAIFQSAPADYVPPAMTVQPPAVSPQATPAQIVPPAPNVNDQNKTTPPPVVMPPPPSPPVTGT